MTSLQRQVLNLKALIGRILSGFALGLALWAAHAASDQSLNTAFERDKIAYIKRYAHPKRPKTSQNEVLFTKRSGSARPATSAPTAPPGTAAPPPAVAPSETNHE